MVDYQKKLSHYFVNSQHLAPTQSIEFEWIPRLVGHFATEQVERIGRAWQAAVGVGARTEAAPQENHCSVCPLCE
jgi:hypothetical protein